MAVVEIVATTNLNIYGQSTNYNTTRSTAVSFSAANLNFGQDKIGSTYYNRRVFLKFDTSSLAGETITQVNLRLTVGTDLSTDDTDVQIVKQDWSAQDPMTIALDDPAYDNCLAGTADNSIWRNTSGIAVNTPYDSGNLDTSWINTAGSTYYSLRSSTDYAGTAPTTREFIAFLLNNNATEAYRPTLVVTTGGGGGSSTPIHLIRTGMQPGMRIGL